MINQFSKLEKDPLAQLELRKVITFLLKNINNCSHERITR